MPEAAMPEARRSERLKSLLRARIVFNAGSSTIECVIKNVSAHGMRLEIADGLSVLFRCKQRICLNVWFQKQIFGLSCVQT